MTEMFENNKFIQLYESIYDDFVVSDENDQYLNIYRENIADDNLTNEDSSINTFISKINSKTKIRKLTNSDCAYINYNNPFKHYIKIPKDFKYTESSSKILKDCDDILNSLKDTKSQSFFTLWNFTQSIKWAEQSIMYENTIGNTIYVDNDIDSYERKFEIRYDSNTKIQFCLALKSKIEEDSSGVLKIINIKVSRDYGRKMDNIYNIVDGNVDYNNSADLYLMNSVNIELSKDIIKVYNDIITTIFKIALNK